MTLLIFNPDMTARKVPDSGFDRVGADVCPTHTRRLKNAASA